MNRFLHSQIAGIQDNAVFVRLTRHSRWPSLRTTVWLFVAALLLGVAGAAALLFVDPTTGTALEQLVGRMIALSGSAVALLGLPVGALITVITTATDVHGEAYQLVRASLLSKKEIVSGYIFAALYRLRLLWVLAFGLLALPTVVATTTYWLRERPIFVAVAALAFWVNGMVAGLSANWLAVCIAVRQAMCREHIEIAIITTLALLSVVGPLMSLAAVTFVCGSPYFFVLIGHIIPRLTYTIREKAESCI